ncbi:uncharacterized protein LOC143261649 [Megalopta genalis]|uniref:uncharacterized protein LOC143261649 n=1 Tax=Megalopta genalis TaxID=115081 RepID=UPI003FD12986
MKLLNEKFRRLSYKFTRLNSILYRRSKRGILNIIGSTSKALFGTLDEDDLVLINQNIDKLFDERYASLGLTRIYLLYKIGLFDCLSIAFKFCPM